MTTFLRSSPILAMLVAASGAALVGCGGPPSAAELTSEAVGHYRLGPGVTASIGSDGGHLTYQPTGQMVPDILEGDPDQGYILEQDGWDARLFFDGDGMVIRKPERTIRCPRVAAAVVEEPPEVAPTATELVLPETDAGSSGSPVDRTLRSLRRVDGVLTMDYRADYRQALEQAADWSFRVDPDSLERLGFSCALFFAGRDRDNPLLGRNFDSAACEPLVVRYSPAWGYSSVALTRTSDLGLELGVDPAELSVDERAPLLAAPFFITDAINERGVALGLASHRPQPVTVDEDRETIHLLRLCRMILDGAASVSDAEEMAGRFNVYDMRSDGALLLEHHVMVADASGRSVVLEGSGGELQAVYPVTSSWQVATNFALYGLEERARGRRCLRYRLLAGELSGNAALDWVGAMRLLRRTSGSTSWSTVYDLRRRQLHLAVGRAYDRTVTVALE